MKRKITAKIEYLMLKKLSTYKYLSSLLLDFTSYLVFKLTNNDEYYIEAFKCEWELKYFS